MRCLKYQGYESITFLGLPEYFLVNPIKNIVDIYDNRLSLFFIKIVSKPIESQFNQPLHNFFWIFGKCAVNSVR